jgi:hypothetical protein
VPFLSVRHFSSLAIWYAEFNGRGGQKVTGISSP